MIYTIYKWEDELIIKFGPTAQLSFKTHVSRIVQSEILIHIRDSLAIQLTEFLELPKTPCKQYSHGIFL